MTYFLEFWNLLHISGRVRLEPSISRERLMLETSNLARMLTMRETNEKKCKIRLKGIGKESRNLILEFWDPLYISRTVEARNVKFGM